MVIYRTTLQLEVAIMKIKYLIAVIGSALLFLFTSWSYNYSLSALWIGCICYYIYTLFLLQNYDDGNHTIGFSWSIVAGRMLAEIPVIMVLQSKWRESFIIAIAAMVGIVLAAVYHRYRYGVVLMLSVVIMILFNTLGYDTWERLVAH